MSPRIRDAQRAISLQPAYCPHCGMSKHWLRFISYTSFLEGFIMGLLAIGLFLILQNGIPGLT